MIPCAAIDYAGYTAPETLDYAALAAAGVRLHLIGLLGNPYATRQIMLARQHGADVETYLIPATWTADGARSMDVALTGIKLVYPTGRIWLDVEPLPHEPTPDEGDVRAWLRGARGVAEAAGYQVGLYGNVRTWALCTGDDPAFNLACAALPKWDADYDGRPQTGFSGPWGGSQTPLVSQYSNIGIGGMNVDLDWYFGEEAEAMDEQTQADLGAILQAVADQNRRIVTLEAATSEFRDDLYRAVTNRAVQAEQRLAYVYAAAGVPRP